MYVDINQLVMTALTCGYTSFCEREKVILSDRLLQDDSRSLKNIAEQFHISRERIRQIEARLLKKIGKTLQQEMPDLAYNLPAA